MKILCCADLHLGRLSSVRIRSDDVDLSAASAWRRIVEEAISNRAHGVVIAGDVFDSVAGYLRTRSAFYDGLQRLQRASIPTIAVCGNHDSEALPRFHEKHPDSGLHLLGLGGTWETREVGGVLYHGWSFRTEHAKERAFATFSPVTSELPVVGILHCDTASEIYNKVEVADFDRGADAWVLGHIHLPNRVGLRARYPGSPQALDFGPGERGPHGFHWLTVGEGPAQFSDLQPISSAIFAEHRISVRPQPGETPVAALRREIDSIAVGYRKADPNILSVNLRVRAEVEGWMPGTGTDDIGNDGSDRCEFLSLEPIVDINPWQEIDAKGAASELARLLVGVRAIESGEYLGKSVDPDWIAEAKGLVERISHDVLSAFSRTLGAVQDAGDVSSTMVESEAASRAAEAVAAYLESELRSARTEVVV